jgi:hypothetical protein
MGADLLLEWGGVPSDLFEGIGCLYSAGVFRLTVSEEIVLAYRLADRRRG